MSNIARQAVVVLGMHRGGTSAAAGTAVRLGLAEPLTSLPAADDNPGGFYESDPIVHINHLILRAAGCAWNVCLTFDPASLDRMIEPPVHAAMANVLRTEFADAPAFVVKDPRLCLTLPAWRLALRQVGANVHALIVVRHPAEVVHSILHRNNLPEIETAPQWLHHMLEAERATRDVPRAFFFYSDLVRDWRGTMTQAGRSAEIAWSRPIEAADRDITAFLAASARHHNAADAMALVGGPGMREWINAAWGMFHRLADDPSSAGARKCLDQIHQQFATWRATVFPPGYQVEFPRR